MKQFCYLFKYSLIINSCIFSITLRRGKVTALWFDILIRSPLLWLFLKNCFRLNKINSRWIAVLLQAYKWTPTQGLLGISCHKKNKGFGGWICRRFLPSLSHLRSNPFAAPSPRPSTRLPIQLYPSWGTNPSPSPILCWCSGRISAHHLGSHDFCVNFIYFPLIICSPIV